MEPPKTPIANVLAEIMSPTDLSAGMLRVDSAMASTNNWVIAMSERAKGASLPFYWVGGIVAIACLATSVIEGYTFITSGAISWFFAIIIVFGTTGFAASQILVILQLLERFGYLPHVFRDPAVELFHDFRRNCLNAEVLVWEVEFGQVDRPTFRSAWAIVLLSEEPRVRSIFLLSVMRSFRRKLTATVVSTGMANATSVSSDVPGSGVENACTSELEKVPTFKPTTTSVPKTGNRRRSSIRKREFLTDLSEDQRERAVSEYFKTYDVPPIQQDKIRQAIKILWQHFKKNMENDQYKVMDAIKATREAIAINFGHVGLTDVRDASGDVAKDRKRKPPGPDSSMWINAIAYGTNRRLKEQLERASGQGTLELPPIIAVS
jgi:hypothetical protein